MIKEDPTIIEATKELFRFEHKLFAANLGLRRHTGELLHDQPLIPKLVFAIDELVWSSEPEDRRLALQLIALTWEHATSQLRDNLRRFFILALSRLGVAPSTQMIDRDFKDSRRYSAIDSFRSKLAVVALQIPSQVVIGKIRYQLTEFQKRVLTALSANSCVGISAPTSAGKSFAIYLQVVLKALQSDKASVFIVPTISLVNQVSSDLRNLLDDHCLASWKVANSYDHNLPRTIFVLTQERAILALDRGLASHKISVLVIDEAQNLEKVGDDEESRSKILFDFLHDIRATRSTDTIILSGPRLENIALVGESVFDADFAAEEVIESPVASITYSIERKGEEFYFNQYRNSLREKSSLKIENTDAATGLLSTGYGDGYYNSLVSLIDGLGDSAKSLVFSPTADQARKAAAKLTGYKFRPAGEQALKELSDYLAESIHPRHRLVELVQRGVAFHTGSLPPHARLVIEQAFADGLLKDIACTTTLMQGVNLPAKYVFVRSPNLYVRKRSASQSVELTEYEFANLRGRAGRLLHDFVGRTVVLDEDAFKTGNSDQSDLFKDAYKSLHLTYADILGRNRDEIFTELHQAGSASSQGAKFITTYIRQQLIRGPADASARLKNVGLNIPDEALQAVERSLKSLSVKREVIIQNRYWDPFDLQKLSDELAQQRAPELPKTAWEAKTKPLVTTIELLAQTFPIYFRKYLGAADSSRFILALVLSGISWAREVPLKTILEDRKFNDDEKYEERIDEQIDLVYRKVIYGLPAILKPIASITGKGHAFLASLESGAYHPVTHYIMSFGLYRETAVYLKRRSFGGIRGDDPDLSSLVDGRVEEALKGLDSWTLRQVRSTLYRK